MNDTTATYTSSERPDPGRSGFARWAYLIFFVFILGAQLWLILGLLVLFSYLLVLLGMFVGRRHFKKKGVDD